MYYTDLIDAAPVTMTARQFRLAIQEAKLHAEEVAFNSAAELVRGSDPAYQQLRHYAESVARDREQLQLEIDAANGPVR